MRSPKWLKSISVQAHPSHAFQQTHDYLLFPPDMREETRDERRGVTITAMPLTSAICEPSSGAKLAAGRTVVRGYTVATDRAVTRVEVSSNGGHDWVQASIDDH